MTRTHLLFALFCFVDLVQGASVDLTASSCPPPDGSSRSVWSILGNCAVTLLICVWHAVHPDIPGYDEKPFYMRTPCIFLTCFVAPEVVVSYASKEWCDVHRTVREFRVQGYEWSTTHSYFAEMGGFVYDDDKEGLRTITSYEFLRLCEKGEIANPFVTKRDIKDKSKSDALGKLIFMVQLFWFILQVIIRGSRGLAVTLVELDTVCMSALALIYIIFWWSKPLRPDAPYVFVGTREARIYPREKLSKAWKSGPGYLHQLVAGSKSLVVRKARSGTDDEKSPLECTSADYSPSQPGKLRAMIEDLSPVDVQVRSLFLTWTLLGGLHLIAWNFEFRTQVEKIIWRVASLVMAVSPVVMTVMPWFQRIGISDHVVYVLGTAGILARVLLAVLMLISLRALPCSAYDVVAWTSYIPHL